MPKYVQLTATFTILDDQDPEVAAEHYTLSLRDAARDQPAATKFWIHTLIADEPLPHPDFLED